LPPASFDAYTGKNNSGGVDVIEVLSAGAVKRGITAAADAFTQATGHEVRISFATAPELRQRIGGGEKADLLIAPPSVLDDLAKAGKIPAGQHATLGRVGVGVAVRSGAPVPKIATTDQLVQSIRDAEAIALNVASTGLYVEKLFERLSLTETVAQKASRFPTGAAAMEHVLQSTGATIGFGATTEIRRFGPQGLVFVGPLPDDIQNYTTYMATPLGDATSELAEFIHFLGNGGKAILAANGVE
jgi:molybdate transport system substrate-binding protein